jgi:anti-sigma factor RsiW
MSERNRDETSEHRDADLSALIDGELDADREAELRARLAADSALAARFEALSEIDLRLRALSREEPSSEQLDRVRAALERRLADAGPAATTGRLIELRPRARVLAPIAAALAASLALYLGLSGPSEPGLDLQGTDASATPEVARTPVPAEPPRAVSPTASAVDDRPLLAEDASGPARAVVEPPSPARSDSDSALELAATLRELHGVAPTLDAPLDIESDTSDEEVAIALQYEMLADLDVIENLDLLERLTELESTDSM